MAVPIHLYSWTKSVLAYANVATSKFVAEMRDSAVSGAAMISKIFVPNLDR